MVLAHLCTLDLLFLKLTAILRIVRGSSWVTPGRLGALRAVLLRGVEGATSLGGRRLVLAPLETCQQSMINSVCTRSRGVGLHCT